MGQTGATGSTCSMGPAGPNPYAGMIREVGSEVWGSNLWLPLECPGCVSTYPTATASHEIDMTTGRFVFAGERPVASLRVLALPDGSFVFWPSQYPQLARVARQGVEETFAANCTPVFYATL